MRVQETCSCGAQVDVTCGADAFERGDASNVVASFREAHWVCRNHVVSHNGSGVTLPVILGTESPDAP